MPAMSCVDWQERYRSKIRSAEQAIRSVPAGRRILIGSGAAEPSRLVHQVAPRGAYPWEETRHESLPEGERVVVRPARLTDEEHLQDLFYRLSDESSYRRFMAFKRTHPHEEIQKLVDLDYDQNMALVARARGLSGFTADVLRTNRPMLAVFQKSNLKLEVDTFEDAYHVVARLDS